MILSVIAAVAGISVLVLVHELGHFVVAKLKGMRVERFSIGMGPKVIGFRYGETEYRLSWFLFGGYVKFFGDELEEGKDPRKIPGGFFTASPWSRILVCFSGGFFNILLAFLLYTVMFYEGTPVLEDSLDTVIGWVKPDSAASRIGLVPGDRILKINNKPVNKWRQLLETIVLAGKEEILLTVESGREIFTRSVIVKPDPKTGARILGVQCKKTIVIYRVKEDSPSGAAGLLEGDRIVAVNGVEIYQFKPFVKTIRQGKGRTVELTIVRDSGEFEVQVVPESSGDKKYGAIGIEFDVPVKIIHPAPWEQFWHDLALAGRMLAALLTRRLPVKGLTGPVGIIRYIGISAHGGWIPFIYIIALISLNLGIINLLPIPVLDGGHIIFTLIEAIRRRPLSLKTIAKIQNVFMALIIMLFIYITYNDVLRWFVR